MKILLRILLLPFIAPLYFIHNIIVFFKAMWYFIKYGGTLQINSEEEL